jgi:hypothetical protein
MSLVTGLLSHLCDVYRPVFASDGKGGWPDSGTPTLVAEGVRCLIDRNGESNRGLQGGALNSSSHRGYFEWADQDSIRIGDIVKNVRDAADATKTDMVTVDAAGETQAFARQYRVLDRFDSNLNRDHLEVALESQAGVPQP